MANVNSLTTSGSSAASSLYGTRNVLSGLASGMDTEAMIENSVSGFKTKITQLQQQQTKYQWKQDAYRGITDKMYDLTEKYTSYASKTNLYSNAFFTGAINTTPTGTNADKVSAVGRPTSDIQILGAKTAAAARYRSDVRDLGLYMPGTNAESAVLASGNETVNALTGSLTLNYDGKEIDIEFDASDTGIGSGGKDLKQAIIDKLSEVNVTVGSSMKKASEVIDVTVEGGKLVFTDKANRGASPYVSSVSGALRDRLVSGAPETLSNGGRKYALSNVTSSQDINQTKAAYLQGKALTVTLDGVTKTFELGDVGAANGDVDADKLVASLQNGLDKSFGVGKVDVSMDADGKLQFSAVNTTSSLGIQAKDERVGEILGFKDGMTNYLNANNSIEKLLGDKFNFGASNRVQLTDQSVINDKLTQESSTAEFYRDKTNGNRYVKEGNDYFRVDENGNQLYELKINGESIYVSKESSLQSVLNGINNSDMGVNASYSALTGKFVFEAKETGASSEVSFDNDLAKQLFSTDKNGAERGAFTQRGSDAILQARVNGENVTLTRSSNTIDMDGMSLTLKESFNVNDSGALTADAASSAVSFSVKTDTDNVMNTIKSFVDDYNAIMRDVYTAFSTRPAEKSSTNHTGYDPLTDEDKATMSEKAIAAYEEKAKQGLLFGDSDLRALYDRLVQNISPTGADSAALKNIGITTSYSGGVTQIKIEEDKLRSALENNPDSVREAFTKSKETGSSSDGLMTNIKNTMEQYASTSTASPGLLVSKAGSTHSSLSLLNNTVQKQIENVQKQIEEWQTKMSTKIDYYTRQFTALEKLMSQMNSQSSAMAGLMGG
ncbi:MAG: flagellar filament capping protein FliD [Oscillibacter sp.]|nr:flagellar filament capping protein FliD [Oscillibacter sp.]